MRETLLEIKGLTKAYPGVIANSDVSFSIGRGEVHALLGENGAGKSTLVKMIYGLVKPDSGSMRLNGSAFAPQDPHAARASGVAMVFQHFSLFEALSVAENVALGMENPPKPRDLARQIREVSETYGLPLDPDRTVGGLSAGERQRVEIIRCLLQEPKLLIMDEPTSVLTPQEVEILFQTLRKLSAEGTAILYISHKLEEIRSLCETATILRLGKVVETCDPRDTTARQLAELMVGASFDAVTREARAPGAVRLAVPLIFGATLLVMWELIVRGLGVPTVILPPPSQIAATFAGNLVMLWGDFVQTILKGALAGWVIGCGAAFLTALLVDRFDYLRRGLLPLGNFMAALPIVGTAPILVMWFGFGWQSKAAVVVLMVYFPMLVNTVAGLQETSAMQRDLMRTYAAGYWTTLFKLRLPAAMPFIFNGLKIASTLALIGAIVAEFFGSPVRGMGFRISTSVGLLALDLVWAEIVVAAIAGSAFYGAIALLEKAVTFWHPSQRGHGH